MIATAIIVLLIIALVVVILNARGNVAFHKRRAESLKDQADNAFIHANKVERDNEDLRRRLTEQGKAWSAKLRKAQSR